MKIKIIFLILAFSGFVTAYSQNRITAFFEYQIRDGMRGQFENGYDQDLEWHKNQGDKWAWIGWFVANGERRGRFIDATPNHNWTDFDNWKIDAGENAHKNQIHWAPYVTNSSGSYKKIVTEFSLNETDWFNSDFLQVYYFELRPGTEAVFQKFLEDFKSVLNKKSKGNPMVWMKTISGGKFSYHLFIGLDALAEFADYEDLLLFKDSKMAEPFGQSVKQINSELWRRSERLSYIPE